MLSITAAVRAAEPAYPNPEDYLPDGRYTAYADKASTYLRQNPDSKFAARVAMDLWIAGNVNGDAQTVAKMRKLILGEYPGSVQQKFLLGLMGNPQDFATAMADVADDVLENPTQASAFKFIQSMNDGVGKFRQAAFGDGGMILSTAILAREAGDFATAHDCAAFLRAAGEPAKPLTDVLDIISDDSTPLPQRILKLHALPNRLLASRFERYLIAKLPAADQSSPDMLRVQADNLLEFGRVSEALPMMEKIPAGTPDESRLMFWRAWAWAAAGDTATSQDLFNQLKQKHPDDPWTKQAADLQPTVSGLDTDLSHSAEAMVAAAEKVKQNLGQIEGEVAYTRPDNVEVGLYTSLVSGKSFEMRVTTGTKTTLAYRTTDKDCTLFIDGDANVYKYAKPGLLPLPIVRVGRSGNAFAFGLNLTMSQNPDDIGKAMDVLLSSPYLSQREGLIELLKSSQRRGEFPMPPVTVGDVTTYSWVTPKSATPGVEKIEIAVNSANVITGVSTPTITVRKLHYGAAGSFNPSTPPFPEGPVVSKDELDPVMMNKILPSVLNAFQVPPPVPPATQPATQTTPG
jgi:hypothetical protein